MVVLLMGIWTALPAQSIRKGGKALTGIKVDFNGIWQEVGGQQPAFNRGVFDVVRAGDDIYIGGLFENAGGNPDADGIVRWDGTAWHSLGSGITEYFGLAVEAVAVIGSSVFAAGGFLDAGGNPDADYIARWDGSTWNALGSGLNEEVVTLAVVGNDLYVGGYFTDAGGIPDADYIARWDGANWQSVGGGLNETVGILAASGNDLYTVGEFTNAGGVANADYIARWDGVSWNALGIGFEGIVDLKVDGSDVYVVGSFSDAGGVQNADNIAHWDGVSWNSVGGGLNGFVRAVTVFGSDVYAAGIFTNAGGNPSADGLARWDGTAWQALIPLIDTDVIATGMQFIDEDLYLYGFIRDAGGNPNADYLAVYNGQDWLAPGTGLDNQVSAGASFGGDVYFGGSFLDAGGDPNADRIATWDGTQWQSPAGKLNGSVSAMAVADSILIVGGSFTNAGGVSAADGIAVWDGSQWGAIGSMPPSSVLTIAVQDSLVYAGEFGGLQRWDGSTWNPIVSVFSVFYASAVVGNDVYFGGFFQALGGVSNADYVARWDGSNWHALGSGVTILQPEIGVQAIAVSGTDVYVGGDFLDAGGISDADYIARWDGTTWHSLGTGLNGTVSSIAVSGSRVYVGGEFLDAGGDPAADRIAMWDGSGWQAMGSGVGDGQVSSITVDGYDVYAAGVFSQVDGRNLIRNIAKWHNFVGEPSAQPSNLVFSNITSTSVTVAYSSASGNPDGYIAFRRFESPPTEVPADEREYFAGDLVGNSQVVFRGDLTTFEDSTLVPGQKAYYSVFSYIGTGQAVNYLTLNPLTGSIAQDEVAPEVALLSSGAATPGQPYQVIVAVTDNENVGQVTLESRSGEATAFGSPIIMNGTGDVYSAEIPGSRVTVDGLIFRIIASDLQGNRDTTNGIITITVPRNSVTTATTPGSPYPNGIPFNQWRLISVPVNLSDKSVSAVLEAFGEPGNKSWALYDAGGDVSSTAEFVVGKAFWLKQLFDEVGRQIVLDNGITAGSSGGRITLVPGWNLIGNPYTFPIDWNTQTDAPGNDDIKGPVKWDGGKYVGVGQTQGDNTPFTELVPWDGYWVFNARSTDQLLTIDPLGIAGNGSIAKTRVSGWRIGIRVAAGRFEDSYNVVGAADGASIFEDAFDLPELPVIGDYVSVYFDHEKEDGVIVPYSIDYRPVGESGYEWDMSVQTNVGEKNHLNFTHEGLPSGYRVAILDVSHNRLVEEDSYAFENRRETHPVRFKIWAGSEAYVDVALQKFTVTLPRVFDLKQNYPNPFNPATTIRFDVAQSDLVQVTIYNLLGQEVATLVNGYLETGRYHTTWNGKDRFGRQAASGVYFFVMETSGYSKSRKMLLLK